MAVPRVYVRRGTTVWIGTSYSLTYSLTDALTLIFLYLYTIGPKGATISTDFERRPSGQDHAQNRVASQGALCAQI